MPATVPTPTPRPEPAQERKSPDPVDAPPKIEKEQPAEVEKAEPPPEIEREDDASYKMCIDELKASGSTFTELPRIDDGHGCGIDRPIELTRLGARVEVKPKAVLRCATALEMQKWIADMVDPMLRATDSAESLAGIDQASAYICRNRNGAEDGKISEHARGNAVDIAALRLTSGKVLEIKPRDEDSTIEGALQRAITAAACLYFTTVLDPGSDKAHETHLHLDVIERKNGYRLCW